ncbi:hypothetical protein Emag_000686 [Eimeria magna]
MAGSSCCSLDLTLLARVAAGGSMASPGKEEAYEDAFEMPPPDAAAAAAAAAVDDAVASGVRAQIKEPPVGKICLELQVPLVLQQQLQTTRCIAAAEAAEWQIR